MQKLGKGKGGGDKGKGKGKKADGKGKSATSPAVKFEGYCNRCGKWGHRIKDCRVVLADEPQEEEVEALEVNLGQCLNQQDSLRTASTLLENWLEDVPEIMFMCHWLVAEPRQQPSTHQGFAEPYARDSRRNLRKTEAAESMLHGWIRWV